MLKTWLLVSHNNLVIHEVLIREKGCGRFRLFVIVSLLLVTLENRFKMTSNLEA